MIPTTIRAHHVSRPSDGDVLGVVTTVLGHGKLEARFHVYTVGEAGHTSLVRDEFWSTEEGAIKQWEAWRKELGSLGGRAD